MLESIRAALAAAATLVAVLCGSLAADEAGFVRIASEASLDGWRGQDMSFWSVEDGALTATIARDHAPPMNQYLVWQGGLVEDFELKLDFRLTGSTTPNTNGGFQFRSRRLPNGDVAGYQVDNNFGQPWKVRLYDEFGRHDLALEGQRSRFDAQGQRHVEALQLEPAARDFRLDTWHEYHLIARGRQLKLSINGNLVADCTDDDPQQFEPAGVLAMQLHTGPPMKAQFRNVRLKPLTKSTRLSPREQLLTTAALDWLLGERTDAHQPPLKVFGKVIVARAASGAGARPEAKIALVEAGYFDGGTEWNTPGHSITVHLRASAAGGQWNSGLFAKRGGHDRVNFNLFSVDLPRTPGADIGFEIRTDDGFFQVSFPVSRIDPAAWHDLVGRYDGRSIEIFCDGKHMASSAATGSLLQNSEPILVGAETDGGQVVRPFSGQLEEAALWTRALGDDEIRLLSRLPTR